MGADRFVPLTLEEFRTLVRRYDFTVRRIDSVHLHHTQQPRRQDFRGLASLAAMWRCHTETRRWVDIAQHVTIDPDGTIWTGRSWRQPPTSAEGRNGSASAGPFMIEVIGDFDAGRDQLQGGQYDAVLGAIQEIQSKNGLGPESLLFHREFNQMTSCPGSGLDRGALLADLTRRSAASSAVSRTGPFGLDEGRVGLALRLLSADATPEPTNAGMDVVERESETAEHLQLVEPPPGDRRARSGPDADVMRRLRPHVVNLVQGEFSSSGLFETSQASVDAIFDEHVAARVKRATTDKPLHLMFWAHGGLVSEADGVRGAAHLLDWWAANGVYAIHFVWETGVLEIVGQLLRVGSARAPDVAARDLWDHTTDPFLERLTSVPGKLIWAGIQRSAERASAVGGGARYVADRLQRLVVEARGRVKVHVAGHSAGSIFHCHFVPLLVDRNIDVDTATFLAPAARIDLFNQTLRQAIEHGQIREFAMFTMAQDYEKRDSCARVYHKSLLYLISLAFEPVGKTPLLGLEECVRRDPECQRIFGFNGGTRIADAVFSRSIVTSGRHASRAVTHTAFDEDTATMNSLLRRVLGKDDVAPIVGFVEGPRRRSWDALDSTADLPAELAIFLRNTGTPAGTTSPGRSSADGPGVEGRVTASGRRIALCVGINKYKIRPLNGSVADAHKWAQSLQRFGFRVRMLLDDDATKARIEQELRSLLEAAGPGGNVVFQFAGHGTYVSDRDGDEHDDARDEALCPFDWDQRQLIVDDDLRAILSGSPPGVNVTCFFDCCYSGTMTRFGVAHSSAAGVRGGVATMRFLPLPREIAEGFQRSRPRATTGAPATGDMKEVVYTACRADQVAFESDGLGDFTRVATEVIDDLQGQVTHAEVLERIRRGFGPHARQEPTCECAADRTSTQLFAGATPVRDGDV